MKNRARKLALTLAATSVALTFQISTGNTSGHFKSWLPGIYPAYDLNDTYVFRSSKAGHTSFISSSNPSKPGSSKSPAGVIFGQGGLYNFHIAQDDKFEIGMTLVFSFKGGNIEVFKIDTPNADVGKKGTLLGRGKVGEIVSLSGGIRVWAGRGDDPFFGNGVGVAKFNAAKRKGKFAPDVFKEDGDLFAKATASFIVVDILNKILGQQIKFSTTTSVKHKGKWAQVDRHANVLLPYVFLADTPAVQADHQQKRPDLDVKERRQAIVNNIFWAVSASKARQSRGMEYANKVADMIMPDVLTYKPGTRASYAASGLNGRPLNDDAMNTVLQLMNGVAIDDNANDAKRYKSQFPYIVSKN